MQSGTLLWRRVWQPGAGGYLYTSRSFNHGDDYNEVIMGDQGLGTPIGRFPNERGVRKIDGLFFYNEAISLKLT